MIKDKGTINVKDLFIPMPDTFGQRIPPGLREAALERSGRACQFVGCTEQPAATLDVSRIRNNMPRRRRYDPSATEDELSGLDNLIVLCATHNSLIEGKPQQFTVAVLTQMRDTHLSGIAVALIEQPTEQDVDHEVRVVRRTPGLLRTALDAWSADRRNPDEAYWQTFFAERPQLLLTLSPRNAVTLEGKCYVGGKAFDNTGGNLLDFLAQGQGNVTLIEIKSPTVQLVGRRYRDNVWIPSREVVGGTVQVLTYRSSLIQNLDNLQGSGPKLAAVDPSCILLVGDLEREDMEPARRRSFELYRQGLHNVLIVTYDELFAQLGRIWEML